MSGITQDTPQNNKVRELLINSINKVNNYENNVMSGEPTKLITNFGSLYSSVDNETKFLLNTSYNPYDGTRQENPEQEGGFLPLLFAPAYYGIKSLFGGENNQDTQQDTQQGGLSFLDFAMPGYSVFKKLTGSGEGGMVLSPEAQNYANQRSVGGSQLPPLDSETVKNTGPQVGSKASLGDRVPATNAGQGVQTWTEYPNKSLSNEDIFHATALARDVENGNTFGNNPQLNGGVKIPVVLEQIKRKRGRPNKKGGFAPLKSVLSLGDAVEKVSNVPIVDKATRSFASLFGLGKTGGAVASPDIATGERSKITAGLEKVKPYDTLDELPLLSGGKKKRNRKPMTEEQKKLFVERMKIAKNKKRIQK